MYRAAIAEFAGGRRLVRFFLLSTVGLNGLEELMALFGGQCGHRHDQRGCDGHGKGK